MSVTPAFPLRRHRCLLAALATVVLASLAAAAPVGAAQGDGASSDLMPPVSSSSSDLAPGDPATITFTGGGWGHGAGMSQYGAYGRAASGKSYQAILRFYYQGTRLAQSDYTGKVAVGIGDRSSVVVLRPRGRVDLRLNNAVRATARNGDVVRVSRTGSSWSLQVNGVEKCTANCGGGSFALTYADGTVVGVDGANAYDHGKIRVVPNSSGRLDIVVADLSMDEYLYGLAEMPSSWPAEALKAQAVAGRSFAQHNIERRRANPGWTKPYDLSSTTGDQVYAGRTKSAGS
ncbi:MAG: hypothetical protein OES57_13925, partial [Acidimicrobiia bacterium]|nr:hypothetical protein [Acidimicrobiia bacterium]